VIGVWNIDVIVGWIYEKGDRRKEIVQMMTIIETTGYKNTKRKIKNNFDVQKKLDKVLSHIEAVKNFKELKHSDISKLYGFKELSSDLSGYYRFGIDKNSKVGKYRLLFTTIDECTIQLEFISDEHYEDFKRYLRKV